MADFTRRRLGSRRPAAWRPGLHGQRARGRRGPHRGAPVVRRRCNRRRRRPRRLPLDREPLADVGLPPRPLALRDGADDPRERPAVCVPADEPLPRRPAALVRPRRRLPGPGRRRPRGADLARGHRRGLGRRARRARATRTRRSTSPARSRIRWTSSPRSAASSSGGRCATSRERARPGSSRGSPPASRPGTRTPAPARTRPCCDGEFDVTSRGRQARDGPARGVGAHLGRGPSRALRAARRGRAARPHRPVARPARRFVPSCAGDGPNETEGRMGISASLVLIAAGAILDVGRDRDRFRCRPARRSASCLWSSAPSASCSRSSSGRAGAVSAVATRP